MKYIYSLGGGLGIEWEWSCVSREREEGVDCWLQRY